MNAVVKAAGRRVRDFLLAGAGFLDRFGGGYGKLDQGPRSPFSHISPTIYDGLIARLRLSPSLMLQVREVREVLARERLGNLVQTGAVRRISNDTPAVAANTLEYNLEGAKTAPYMARPNIMIGVVAGIEKIWKNIDKIDVLSIGPRSEAEIFAIIAAGFNPSRIKALDLFSYSPLVDIGDMHKMPYPDNSFDVVFVGWVLSYSKDQAAAAREYLRVTKPGGIIVLAGDYSDDAGTHLEAGRDRKATFDNETTHMQSVDQLLSLFSGNVGQIYFRHEPILPDIRTVMTVFEVK